MKLPSGGAAQRLLEGARRLGIDVGPDAVDRLLRFAGIVSTGDGANVTAIRAFDQVLVLHVLDSLAGLRVLDRLPGDGSLVDVGTGAGFPGLALACARPQWSWTLIDATRKKIEFVRSTAAMLGLSGVNTVWGRVEELGRREGFRDAFAVAVARAVAPLAVLVELALPLVRAGGHLIAYKGPRAEEELRDAQSALAELTGELVAVDRFQLPFDGGERALVWITKRAPTPPAFPRRPGMASKRPLGRSGRGKIATGRKARNATE